MSLVRVASCCLCAVMYWHCAKANAEPIGLVLSGGGAKGAYEVGVWQGLQDLGLASNVTVISGTSVGAINAALFATKPDAAEPLWLENMKDIFSFNTNTIGRSVQTGMDIASNSLQIAEESGESWRGWAHFLLTTTLQVADKYVDVTQTSSHCDGYLDSTRLAAALNANLPSVWPQNAPTVYATAVEKGSRNVRKTWRLNDEPHERRVLMIRASAALPVGFDSVEIDGKTHIDGGLADNVPIGPILENHSEVKTMVVVYLDDAKQISNFQRRVKQAAGWNAVRVIEVIPTQNINGWFGVGGVFDSRPATARRLIKLGRKDVRKALQDAGFVKAIPSRNRDA